MNHVLNALTAAAFGLGLALALLHMALGPVDALAAALMGLLLLAVGHVARDNSGS